MPLVRVEVRNEYRLGMPELYTETNREDPKAVLDGVAVAGLVGILRQLGDLSEFAAEVFHGIEEQVLITSSRSYKLGERLCNIEAALPSLEMTILAQRSHLHFAYTSGSHWHTQPRIKQNHFIDDDLPLCIMDSYEDCHDPPRLHKLDKYDSSGRGSCFKRYSDPTYFKKASAGPYGIHLQSVTREKKARRSKKKKSFSRPRDNSRDAPIFTHVSGTDFTSRNSNTKHSPSQDVSTIHIVPKHQTEPEMEDHLTSFDSRNGSSYIECIIRSSYSTQSEENEAKEPSSYLDSTSLHGNSGVSDENVENSNLQANSGPSSSFVTWDEKLEIVESTENEDLSSRVDLIDFDFRDERLAISVVFEYQPDEIESEIDYNNLDPLNIIESESETDAYCKTKSMCSPNPKQITHESHIEAHTFSNNQTETSHQNACTSLISSTSSADDFKSEKGEIYGSNGVFSSSREPNSQPLLSTSGAFWTNGGLLGLAPSKPPDSEYNLIQKDAIEHDEHVAEADIVRNGSKSESSSKYPDSNGLNHVQKHVFNALNTAPDGTVSKVNKISSSRIFEFSNRIISLVGDEKLASSMQSDVPKNPNGKPFEEQFGNRSPSSPPLQHMRISFKPIDGFETCKLKLEFPNESIGTCCSFQLVPESAILLHKSGLDSEDDDDDDTFFRSSPYVSESNSEKWDSDDSPRITSYELVDAFGRISSAESVSNGGHESGFTEIPNFDSLKASLKPHPDVTIDKEDTLGPLKPDCFVGTVDCFSNHKELDVQE